MGILEFALAAQIGMSFGERKPFLSDGPNKRPLSCPFRSVSAFGIKP